MAKTNTVHLHAVHPPPYGVAGQPELTIAACGAYTCEHTWDDGQVTCGRCQRTHSHRAFREAKASIHARSQAT